jgi:L-lactate dehydrogenase
LVFPVLQEPVGIITGRLLFLRYQQLFRPCFAIGLALVRITGAILRGERSVLTVSTSLDGEFGLRDVSLSVPPIVSERGVVKIIESQLPENELAALTASASVLKKAMEQLDLDA